MNTITINILKLCKQHHLSQRKLSALSGVPLTTLNDNINHRSKYSEKTLNKIARALNTTVSNLCRNTALDDYLTYKKVSVQTLHNLDNIFLFFAHATDNIPQPFDITLPFLVIPDKMYVPNDLILYFNGRTYAIDYYKSKDNFTQLGKVIGQLTQL